MSSLLVEFSSPQSQSQSLAGWQIWGSDVILVELHIHFQTTSGGGINFITYSIIPR